MALSELLGTVMANSLAQVLATSLGIGADQSANAQSLQNDATKYQRAVADARLAGLSPLAVIGNASSAPVVSSSSNLQNFGTNFGAMMNSLASLSNQQYLQENAQDFTSTENEKERSHQVTLSVMNLTSQEKMNRERLYNEKVIADNSNSTQLLLKDKDNAFKDKWNSITYKERLEAFNRAKLEGDRLYRLEVERLKQAGQQMKINQAQWVGDYIFKNISHFLPSGDGVIGAAAKAYSGN